MDIALTQAQAQAVYSAMCALNNVGGRIKAEFPAGPETITITEDEHGYVTVCLVDVTHKDYANQASFAAAYGLQ